MNIFGKKKEKKTETKKLQSKEAEFKILIWTKVAGSRRLVKVLNADRYVDEDKIPFIYNEELKFMELYPQDIKKTVKKYDEKAIKLEIIKVQKDLDTIRKKNIEDYKEEEPNTLDLEHKLMTLTAKLRYVNYTEEDNAYEYYDDTGRVCIDFLRKGNTFFPLKCDLDTNTIHTASEPVVKKAGILLRNKENKYLPKRIIETSTLILLGIVIVAFLGNLFFGGWLWSKYDESALGEFDRNQLELNDICSVVVKNNAETVLNMQNEFKKQVNGTTTTQISGIIPQ